MKKLLLFIITLAIGHSLIAQVNNSYAFAVGNTDGVNVNWDAYSDSVEILGCYLYKKVTYEDEFELISSEMIVSDDSAFSYTDTGVFNVGYPPIYSIHVVTPTGQYELNQCYACGMLEFEVINSQRVDMEVQAWSNNKKDLEFIKVWLGGIFLYNLNYDDGFLMEFWMEEWYNHEDNYIFASLYHEFELEVTYTYIHNLILSVNTAEIDAREELFQNSPNPFSTTTQIQFDLYEQTPVLLEVYNTGGQLIQVVANETLAPGNHSYMFNRRGLPRGLYFYKLSTNRGVRVNKMVVE